MALDGVTRLTEACDSFQGFMIFHSAGGGTGSGFQAMLSEWLDTLYYKKCILDFAIYPSLKVIILIIIKSTAKFISSEILQRGKIKDKSKVLSK